MDLFKFIDLRIFFFSLVVGLLFVYIVVPETRTVYVYPTPENVDDILYRDKTGQCFQMKEKQVMCPSNDAHIYKVSPQ